MFVAVAYCIAIEIWLPRQDAAGGRIDAVMVLSSSVREDGTLDPNAHQRFRRGIELAKAVGAPLYVSRVIRIEPPILTSDSGQKIIADSARFGSWAALDGVATNTRNEAERLLMVIPGRSIAVVTSRLHTRRACSTFEQLGFEVTCVSSGSEGPPWWAPYYVLYESAALVEYRWRGWLARESHRAVR